VAVSCASLPETLLESELFGHEKGAFTSALTQRKGRFELANKGTLFLDEVGEISPNTQKKLLRVLQEREFERVGGSTTIKVDVRVIAATNADLQESVAKKEFREDLFYRLNVINIRMPPLRDRREDIPLLVQHFLSKYRLTPNSPPARITEDAIRALHAYHWPGNVRQLENVIQRAVVMSQGDIITRQHLLLEEASVPEFVDI
jgi:two-component system response regulator AtoC